MRAHLRNDNLFIIYRSGQLQQQLPATGAGNYPDPDAVSPGLDGRLALEQATYLGEPHCVVPTTAEKKTNSVRAQLRMKMVVDKEVE